MSSTLKHYPILINGDLITASTFHSFAKDIVDNNYSKLGYSKDPVLIDKDGLVYLFLKKIDNFKDFKSKSYIRFPIKALKSLLSIHDQFRQELFDDNDLNNLIDTIKFRRNQISQEAKRLFKVGDKVFFLNKKKGKVDGMVTKINKKYIIVDETHGMMSWRVSPTLLEKS